MKVLFSSAIRLFMLLTLIVGLIYPFLVFSIGQIFFPNQIAGSLITQNNTIVGSVLIGQNFTNPRYFWGRPSATTPNPYNSLASNGSNLGPLNPALITAVKERITRLKKYPTPEGAVPVDLVTASGSGLDPQISVAGALYQVERVAQARQLPVEKIQELVKAYVQDRQFGLFGEASVNVLELNLALDKL